MFGIGGDDLTVVLFLVGLAATFGVAAISQAGWKHWTIVSMLFVLAAIVLSAGLAWPWIKDFWPTWQQLVVRIARNPISWFSLIILALTGLLVINKTNTTLRSSNAPIRTRTGITLKYEPGQSSPTASKMQNIWRWYNLTQVVRQLDLQGNVVKDHKVISLFIIFDKPVAIKQIMVSGAGDLPLPAHELKDWGVRHALIVFGDDLDGFMVEVRART